MARVGILGLGKMGSAFATNLLSKRNEVHVYNRSKDRLRGLIAKGAVAHPSPIELGKSVDGCCHYFSTRSGRGRQHGHGRQWGRAGHEEGSNLARDEYYRPGRLYQAGRTSEKGGRR